MRGTHKELASIYSYVPNSPFFPFISSTSKLPASLRNTNTDRPSKMHYVRTALRLCSIMLVVVMVKAAPVIDDDVHAPAITAAPVFELRKRLTCSQRGGCLVTIAPGVYEVSEVRRVGDGMWKLIGIS